MLRAVLLIGMTLAMCVRIARADQLTFPLTVDFAVLDRTVEQQLGAPSGGRAVLWGVPGGCRSLVLGQLRFANADGRLRLQARGTGRLGFGLLGFCLAPVSWDGYLETLSVPTVGPDWRLRFGDVHSTLYDTAWKRPLIAGRLWDLVRGRVESEMAAFAFDLGPPIDEARAVVRACGGGREAAPVLEALSTMRPLDVRVVDEGVKVDVAIDLPSPAGPIAEPGPEPELTGPETESLEAALQRWDGFLVFVVKDLGLLHHAPAVRDQLLDLLLDSRERLVATLAAPPAGGGDPVRALFLQTWERLRAIVHEAALHGGLEDRALRYSTFLAAGDALAAL